MTNINLNIMKRNNIKNAMLEKYKNDYSKWIIVYDLLNLSFYELSNMIKRKRITIEDIEEVIDGCNEIENIFDKEFILKLI